MKKVCISAILVVLMVILVGCGQKTQKEPIQYSQMSEFETSAIELSADVIKEFGEPNKIITNTKDMEAIIRGYKKNLESPKSTGDVATDAVNKLGYAQLIELAEKTLDILSSLEKSENFKALEYRTINSKNEEYKNYYIFDGDKYVAIFWDDMSYLD